MRYLLRQIGREVGSAHDWPVIIVGLGNLGTALANYSGFYSRGFRVVGLVDPTRTWSASGSTAWPSPTWPTWRTWWPGPARRSR